MKTLSPFRRVVTDIPLHRATLCKGKAEGWYKKNGNYSLEQLQAEIERLTRLKISYITMGEAMGFVFKEESISIGKREPKNATYPVKPDSNDQVDQAPDTKTADTAVKKALKDLYASQGAFAKKESKKKGGEKNKQETDLDNKRKALADAIETQGEKHLEYTKWAIANMKEPGN